LAERIERLKAYEASQHLEPVPLESIIGPELYAEYWSRLDRAIDYLRECHGFALTLKARITAVHGLTPSAHPTLKEWRRAPPMMRRTSPI
jgi:hypothetical protein